MARTLNMANANYTVEGTPAHDYRRFQNGWTIVVHHDDGSVERRFVGNLSAQDLCDRLTTWRQLFPTAAYITHEWVDNIDTHAVQHYGGC